MTARPDEIICIFPSNTLLLNAEDALEEGNMPYKLIPVPKQVYSNCGLALSIQEDIFTEVLLLLKESGLEPGTIYKRWGDNFERL